MLISFRRVPHLSHKSEIIRFISDFCVAQGPKGPQHFFFFGPYLLNVLIFCLLNSLKLSVLQNI